MALTCPAHEVDLYDMDQYQLAMPLEKWARLRAEEPVFHHPDPEQPHGFWAVTSHADVEFVSRNAEIFSSAARGSLSTEIPEEDLQLTKTLLINMDAPEHTRQRGLVNRGFTPRLIGKLEERIGDVCQQIVADAVAKGEGDFVTLCSAELPLIVICELMGVPQEDRHRVFAWSNKMIGHDDPEFGNDREVSQQAMTEMFIYANELAEVKRKQLQDDIVSKLLTPDEAGEVLSELEFDIFFLLLAVAGNETTRNAISGGMRALVEHPDQWERLKADRSLVPTAADEIVRWVSPVMQFRRTAMKDVELGGAQIKAGDKILIYYPSANRDEKVFENPDTFDVGRNPNPHLGFGGGGPHFCLGRHLAKLEIEQILYALLDQVEKVEIIGEVRRLRSNFINGIKEMPVKFYPANA
ncbi:MAG TPA: cytochrome P450 [Mycobacteriales bacterium]|nr:cytochrome P450 [Mycobacteriales bacterium]